MAGRHDGFAAGLPRKRRLMMLICHAVEWQTFEEVEGVVRSVQKAHPRTKPPEERRDELMNAAQHRFVEHGVGPTTIEQITSTANVAKGTFYLHFSSKEEILAALGDRFAQQHLARIQAAIVECADTDWNGKLATWTAASISFYLDSIRLHDVLFYTARYPTREGLVDNIVIDHLAGLLQSGTAAGAWTIDDCRSTAVFIFSGLHGVVDHAYVKERRVNRNRLLHRAERLCLRTVGLPCPD
jgi:AcrR family transcriptional regulator